MDKVRAFLGVLWRQRFWVLSVVGVLVAAICWMMASGSLQAQFAANKGVITGKFGDMDKIKNASVHGNERVNSREFKEASTIAESVNKLWQRLYDYQSESVLKWPASLGDDYLETIKDKKFGSSISTDMRNRYLNYIRNQFDALVKIVQAQKMAENQSFSGDMSRAFDMTALTQPGQPGVPQEKFLVVWADQGALQQQLTFPTQPTAMQIWVTQEDLWVFETLLNAIARTNTVRGATRIDNAAIPVIASLEVGPKAALANKAKGQILMPTPVAGGEMPMEVMRGGEMPMGDPSLAAEPGAADTALLANRYVDDTGAPIADGATGGGVEYRRLPVRMVLLMDPRWLPQILVECANSALPIEVQRLRINGEKSGVGFEASMAAAATAAPSGMEMGRGGEMGGYRGEMGSRGGEMGGTMFSQPSLTLTPGMPGFSADMATIEIQGVVYIYNKPDPAALTIPGGEAAAPETVAAADAGTVR